MKVEQRWLSSSVLRLPRQGALSVLMAAAVSLFAPAQAFTPQTYDYGDAPAPYPEARHTLGSGLVLGARADAEAGTLANSTATGDDISPAGVPSDEDGVTFVTTPLEPGKAASVQVVVSARAGGLLDAWIDFNRNGSWSDPGEQIFSSRSVVGTATLVFDIPPGAAEGFTFARFRLSSNGKLGPSGTAADGEVEDYMVEIKKPVQFLDYGDASEKYPVTLSQDGARHVVQQGFYLGKTSDVEADGQPSVLADGDDNNPPTTGSDEDGVKFLSVLKPGAAAQVEITLSSGEGLLDAWIDFNGNGSWLDAGEKIFDSKLLLGGPNTFTFTVPSSAAAGTTFARFRLSQKGGLLPTGLADSGEVEDYAVTIQKDQLDFGDAPEKYPVTLAQNGARHQVLRGVFMGNLVDDEPDGQPSSTANGDDLNPIGATDDEDGVTFLTDPLTVGSAAQVQVVASVSGFLDAWIDFNQNGSWEDLGEQIFTSAPLKAGPNILTFNVPASALDNTFARFRFSLKGGLKSTGLAPDGEVEDYLVKISREQMDYGDAPQSYPVTFAQNGARHSVFRGFNLGTFIDAESDGQTSTDAQGDDFTAGAADDEDGVTFPGGSILAGQTATVQVIATSERGKLDAWIDFNRNGSWADNGEKIFNALPLAFGTNNLTFTVPADAVAGDTFARFRYSETGGLSFTGYGGDGEVEDHPVRIDQLQLDFGDAPQQYPTLLSQDGARHRIVKGINLGRLIDAETDGQPSTGATGDDNNPTTADDEDGVKFLSDPLPAGSAVQVEVVSSVSEARLDAWVDFNGNGSWNDLGEQVFSSVVLHSGTNTLTFNVPATAGEGTAYARFRMSMRGGLKPTGLAPDGEVEDYPVRIQNQQIDFGDAPRTYPVFLAQDGARHQIVPGFFLGKLVDAEPDGQPTGGGDDLNPPNAPDDEDGVRFIGPIQAGATAHVEVTASQEGMLDAWVDFNRNGSWDDAGEQIFITKPIGPGANLLDFSVPSNASAGEGGYARFRFSRKGGLSVRGAAPDGEVEDYPVVIVDRGGVPCIPRDHRGTNFWLTFPGNYAPDPDNPVNIRLHIVGPRETTGTVSIPGLGYLTNFVIPGSQEKVIVLPKQAELGNSNELIQTNGIHVTASQLVAVYGMNRVKYTSDGYLGLPTDVIGTRYVVAGYGNEFSAVPDLNGTQFALVATQDGTVVSITPKVTTGSHPAGTGFSVTLNQGQTFQFRNTNDFNNDLTGSTIQADKPIAVFGSHQCSTVPNANVFFCDHIVEQLPPVERAGTIFAVGPLATRTSATYRFTAVIDGTIVNVNGVNVALLNAGQFAERIITGPSQVLATHPIFLSQYANSSDYDGVINADPFMILIPPVSAWLNQYLITAPDLGFTEHYVGLVARSSTIASLALDGVVVPAAQFSVIPATTYSYARLKVSPGVHSLTCASPFGATVYGWGEYDSYGFPAGMFFGDTDPPQLECPGTITVTLTQGPAGASPCTAVVPDLRSQVKVSDNCGLSERVVVSQSPAPGTAVGPGVTLIILTAFDAVGNLGFCQVPFEVIDPTPLQLSCPQDLFVRCNTNGGAYVEYAPVTRRKCGPAEVPVTYDPPSGSFFAEGTTTPVKVTAVDPQNDNLTLTCTFNVTVKCEGGDATINPSFSHDSGNFTLNWSDNGVLEQATAITGPWNEVQGAQGSYTVRATNAKSFYRLRLVP